MKTKKKRVENYYVRHTDTTKLDRMDVRLGLKTVAGDYRRQS